jgi:hypothetical protein
MEVERARPVLRERGNMGPPAKKTNVPEVKKTISAATVFKQYTSKVNRDSVTPQGNLHTPKYTVEDANATTLLSAKSHSSARSSSKTGGKVARKRPSDMHPLGVAFKGSHHPAIPNSLPLPNNTETTDDYRRHLYKTTSLKINKTLESLLQALYESTLQTIPPNSHQSPSTSPLKLSAPARYERLAVQLYQPISQYTLTLRRTDSNGKTVRIDQTLETRMQNYAKRITEQAEKVARLQKEWESVVGEIWRLGVGRLGEETMEGLLFTKKRQFGGVPEAESTLFVSEDGTSPPRRGSKKRVTFLEETSDVASTSTFPAFLYQPSRYRKDTLPVVRSLPESKVMQLERSVKELGKREIEEFKRIEREQKEFWRRKTAQLAMALKAD